MNHEPSLIWTVTCPVPLSSDETDFLGIALDIDFFWLSDPEEWVVGVSVISQQGDDAVTLEVARRANAVGFDFSLRSSVDYWTEEMSAFERDRVLRALISLPATNSLSPSEVAVLEHGALPTSDISNASDYRHLRGSRWSLLWPARLPRERRQRDISPMLEMVVYGLAQLFIGLVVFLLLSGFVNETANSVSLGSINLYSLTMDRAYIWITAISVLVVALAASASSLKIKTSMNSYVRERLILASSVSVLGVILGGSLSISVALAGVVGELQRSEPSGAEISGILVLAGFSLLAVTALAATLHTPSSKRGLEPRLDPIRVASALKLQGSTRTTSVWAAILGTATWVFVLSGLSSLIIAVGSFGLEYITSSEFWLAVWFLHWRSALWAAVIQVLLFGALALFVRGRLDRKAIRWFAGTILLVGVATLFLSLGAASGVSYTLLIYCVLPVTYFVASFLPRLGDLWWGRCFVAAVINENLSSNRRRIAEWSRLSTEIDAR